MTVEEILKQCNEQISMLGEIASVTFIMPGKWGKTNKRRLCKGGPVGTIVSDYLKGPGIIVLFDATEVKQFLSSLPI